MCSSRSLEEKEKVQFARVIPLGEYYPSNKVGIFL